MIAFVSATYYIALGKLADEYIDKEKLKDVSQSLQSVIEENTDSGATDYLPVVTYVVNELKPDLKEEFDSWMWVIIAICGALALLLVVLAVIGVICYMKMSSKKAGASRTRSSNRAGGRGDRKPMLSGTQGGRPQSARQDARQLDSSDSD